MTAEPLCHCGKPLHYTSTHAKALVQKLIERLGETVEIQTATGRYRVPRHYIALHGVRAVDLPTLGFEKIT